jgi:aerobic carbon-monoxide dehydrogenase medium subunit
MKPAAFDYCAARTVDDAIERLAQGGEDARPLAGGQSLIPMLAFRIVRPSVLIDLNRIDALAGISVIDSELRIGAMTRQAQALNAPLVAEHAPLLAQALREVGHPPTRARGTIGGSLAHADPSAELPAVMVALDARLVIRNMTGERIVSAADFFHDAFETAIQPGELLIEIRIPLDGAGGSAFQEISLRKGDFGIVCVAACVMIGADDRCTQAALVLGGVAATPVRCREVETRLVGRQLSASAIATALDAIPKDQFELDSRNASRLYRLRLAPVLARRALLAAASGARPT